MDVLLALVAAAVVFWAATKAINLMLSTFEKPGPTRILRRARGRARRATDA